MRIALAFLLACCPLAAQISLTASTTSAIYGQSVTLTATVSPDPGSGKVTFYDGVAILGIRPIAAGQATLTTTQLSTGARTLRARYNGSTSAPLHLTVNSVEAHGFAPSIPLIAGLKFGDPVLTVVADFNNDGKPDLALVDASQTSGQILLGNGDGTFQPPIAFNFPGHAHAMATGDFNGDGIPDLVLTGDWNGLTILPGIGDGTFLTPLLTPGATNATSIAVADFNNDGTPDLAIGTPLSIFLGNGDGTFRSPLTPGQNLSSLAVGDFDNNGIPDLIAISEFSLTMLLGLGDGSFRAQPAMRSAGTAVAVGDLNGDGVDDIATSWGQILLGNGDGTFRIPPPPFGSPGTAALIADFNGDGKMDGAFLVNNTVVLFLGNGDGTFQKSQLYYVTTPTSLVAADFNGDGRIDLVAGGNLLLASQGLATTTTLDVSPAISTYGQPVTLTATVSPPDATGFAWMLDSTLVPLINGRAKFTTTTLRAGTAPLTATYTGDLRYAPSTSPAFILTVTSARPTITLTASANPIAYGQSITLTATISPAANGALTLHDRTRSLAIQPILNGTATFTIKLPAAGLHSLSVSYSGDANVLPGVSPRTLLHVSPGSLTTPRLTVTSSASPAIYNQPVTLTASLSAPDATGTVAFLLGQAVLGTAPVSNGHATLTTRLETFGNALLKAIYQGDAHYTLAASTPSLFTVKTRPAASFGQPLLSPAAGIAPRVAVDLNRDGITDIVGTTGILLGNGDGTFQPPIALPRLGGPVTDFAIADFNADGIPDLAILNGSVGILLGNGDGTFRIAVDPLAQYASAIAVADFDGDGKPDVLVVASSNGQASLAVYPGNGDGTFQSPLISPVPPANSAIAIAIGDFNGDGIPDVAFSGNFTYFKFFTTYIGNGDGTFQPEFIETGDPFSMVTKILTPDLNGDGLSDLILYSYFSSNGHTSSTVAGRLSLEGGASQPVAIPAGNFLLADFNGDGILDLISATGIFLGNGDATFRLPIPDVKLLPNTTLAADFNGDGIIDLAGYDSNGNITVALGTPALTASSQH